MATKKNKKRTKLVGFSEREKEVLTNQKIKSLIDFDEPLSASNHFPSKKIRKSI